MTLVIDMLSLPLESSGKLQSYKYKEQNIDVIAKSCR